MPLQNDPSSSARERAVSRNAIVESYTAVLPSVQRKLLFEQIHVPKKNITWRREGKHSSEGVDRGGGGGVEGAGSVQECYS